MSQPALIASGVSVNLSAGTVGQFQYVALTTAVTLDANTEYYIVSRENSGQDAWAFSTATAFSSPVVGTIEGSITIKAAKNRRPI